jgi:bla regulator protein BlaR1
MIAALIDHLWQSTLFCAAVGSITLLLRAHRAALRHALWMLASVKFLVPFAALYALGAAAGLPGASEEPVVFGQAVALATPVLSPTVVLAPASSAAPLPWIAAALWLAGAAWLALRWFTGWRAANSLTWATRPAPGTSPSTRVTDELVAPSVARVFDPVVLLPAALLRRLSEAQLRAVLAHEHEHIARQDNLKAHVHRLVETLFWFHPVVWWIGRQLTEERERACDEAVVEAGHDAGEYAAGILTVCRHCCAARSSQNSSALAGDLTSRIRFILERSQPRSVGFLKGGALATLTMAAAMVPLVAGALDGETQRLQVLARYSALLDSATVDVHESRDGGDATRIVTTPDAVVVHNGSLRDLVALAYGVSPWSISGGGPALDEQRYDVRVLLPEPIADTDDFDPQALRGVVARLLGARFDLEIHVNRQCQEPCGRVAKLQP